MGAPQQGLLGAGAAAGDPYYSLVVSHLHLNGANGSTTITCQKGLAWTAVNNAQISTASPKFGSGAALFDGTGDYLQCTAIQSVPGTPWTMECWLDTDEAIANGNRGIVFCQNGSGFGIYATLSHGTTGIPDANMHIRFHASSNGTSNDIANNVYSDGLGNPTALQNLNYVHYVLQFTGTHYQIFFNGVRVLNVASTAQVCAFDAVRLGGTNFATNQTLNGKIDEFRYTAGVARYIDPFTPPTAAFPDF